MGKGLLKLINLLLFVLLIIYLPCAGFALENEEDSFKEIENLAAAGKRKELIRASEKFFKEYPKSNLIADVRFKLAENESDPGNAIRQYQLLVNKYRYFKKRDIAQYRICELLYLQAKWTDLERESGKGIRVFSSSEYLVKFRFMLVRSLIRREQFIAAKETCLDILKYDHNYNTLSDALILLAYINRNIYGLSKSYLYSLNEIITGFEKSNNMPGALFLLGRYYEAGGDYNKAFSAYSDVVSRFPRSSEAELSRKQLASIAHYNPVRAAYIPDAAAIKKTDKIDIQPEIDIEEEKKAGSKTGESYSVSLGPFNKINHAKDIENIINKDFQPIETAKTRSGFTIYAGKFSGIDQAIKAKIRLAEEFGINGNIVKVIKDSKKTYIYAE